jgi:hypothetical protein
MKDRPSASPALEFIETSFSNSAPSPQFSVSAAAKTL